MAASFSQIIRFNKNYIQENYGRDSKNRHFETLHLVENSRNFWPVTCLRFSPDGEELVVGYKSGQLQEINRQTGKVLWCRKVSPTGVRCVKYCTNLPFIFVCNRLGQLSLQKKIDDISFPLNPEISDVSWFNVEQSCKYIFAGFVNGDVRILQLPSAKVVREFKNNLEKPGSFKYHTMRISNVVAHPTYNDLFFSSSLDSTVKIWDLRNPKGVIGEVRGPYVTGDALDVMQDKILTGSSRLTNCLQLWDIRMLKLPLTINPLNNWDNLHGQYINSCKFLKGENFKILCDIGGLGYLNVIDSVYRRVIGRIEYDIRIKIKSIDSFDKYIAFGGTKNTIIIAYYGEVRNKLDN